MLKNYSSKGLSSLFVRAESTCGSVVNFFILITGRPPIQLLIISLLSGTVLVLWVSFPTSLRKSPGSPVFIR
jgi:hypothetical protein